MKVDYSAHDEAYRQLRQNGATGWNTPEQLAETIDLLEQFFESSEVPRSGRALELGCGAGDLTIWLARKGYDTLGVDISPAAIDWARQKFQDRGLSGEFRVASVLDLSGLEADSFDIVLDGHCLHCIIGSDRARFLANAYRLLRPGGIFHVATMCGPIHDAEIRASFDPESGCIIRNEIAIRQIKPPEEILREIEFAGFHIARWEIDRATDYHDLDDLLVNAIKNSPWK